MVPMATTSNHRQPQKNSRIKRKMVKYHKGTYSVNGKYLHLFLCLGVDIGCHWSILGTIDSKHKEATS